MKPRTHAAFGVLGGVILLAACAVKHQRTGIPTSLGGGLAVRDFLRPEETPPKGLAAYGYVVFTHRPTDETQPRFLNICQNYVAEFEPAGDLYKVDSPLLMVTFWPLSTRSVPTKDANYCKELVDRYDYRLGSEISAAIGEPGAEGPLLVAWNAPFSPGMQGAEALIIDLSEYTDPDIDRALRLWKTQITKGPAKWKEGLFTMKAREKIRNLFQRNGISLVEAIKILSSK